MKRYFPILVGLCLLVVGLTLCDTLSVLPYEKLTVYNEGVETVYLPGERLPSTRGKYVRADYHGDYRQALSRLSASVVAAETLEDMTIIYAFSPRISAYEELRYGRVNVMIAVRGDSLAVGSPLLKGSY